MALGENEEYKRCPICHSIIEIHDTVTDVDRELTIPEIADLEGQGIHIWSHDPLKTNRGLAGDDYKGFNNITVQHIQELQEARTQQEIDIGIPESNRTIFTSIDDTEHINKKHIRELRQSTEQILEASGIELEIYFNYDEDGILLGTQEYGEVKDDKTEWKRINREDEIPYMPDNTVNIYALDIEELRHPLRMGWFENWINIDPSPFTYDFSGSGQCAGTFTYTTGLGFTRDVESVSDTFADFKSTNVDVTTIGRGYIGIYKDTYSLDNVEAPRDSSTQYANLEDWGGVVSPSDEITLNVSANGNVNFNIQARQLEFDITGNTSGSTSKMDISYNAELYGGGELILDYAREFLQNPQLPNISLSKKEIYIEFQDISWSSFVETDPGQGTYKDNTSECSISFNITINFQYPDDYVTESLRGQIATRVISFTFSNRYNTTPSGRADRLPLIANGTSIVNIHEILLLSAFAPPESAPMWFIGGLDITVEGLASSIMSPQHHPGVGGALYDNAVGTSVAFSGKILKVGLR